MHIWVWRRHGKGVSEAEPVGFAIVLGTDVVGTFETGVFRFRTYLII